MVKFLKFVVAGLILMTMTGCSLKNDQEQTTTSLTPVNNDILNQDPQNILSKTKADLEKAKEAARSWNEDAVLVAYNIMLPQNMKTENIEETFVFSSEKVHDFWWTYTINTQGKTTRAMVYKEDYLGIDLKPVEEQFWKTSYVTAFQTAQDNGGLTFMAQNPETVVTIILAQGEPKGWLWYVIKYKSASSTKEIRISANDGKLYSDKGELLTPAK